jgi:hypothetical protein
MTGAAAAAAGGGKNALVPVWVSLLVFQSLRALGFAYRFWKDPKYVCVCVCACDVEGAAWVTCM